jgi:hypothetical protein
MDDPRVTYLVANLLRDGYFDNADAAWRAATRLVIEMDLLAGEETGGATGSEDRDGLDDP